MPGACALRRGFFTKGPTTMSKQNSIDWGVQEIDSCVWGPELAVGVSFTGFVVTNSGHLEWCPRRDEDDTTESRGLRRFVELLPTSWDALQSLAHELRGLGSEPIPNARIFRVRVVVESVEYAPDRDLTATETTSPPRGNRRLIAARAREGVAVAGAKGRRVRLASA